MARVWLKKSKEQGLGLECARSAGENPFCCMETSFNMEELVEYKDLVDVALKDAQVVLDHCIKSKDALAMADVLAQGHMQDRTNLSLW